MNHLEEDGLLKKMVQSFNNIPLSNLTLVDLTHHLHQSLLHLHQAKEEELEPSLEVSLPSHSSVVLDLLSGSSVAKQRMPLETYLNNPTQWKQTTTCSQPTTLYDE